MHAQHPVTQGDVPCQRKRGSAPSRRVQPQKAGRALFISERGV